MKLSKIEMELMVETNCVRTTTSSYGGRVLEKDEKTTTIINFWTKQPSYLK